MYFFMITIYFLSFITFISLVIAGAQGLFGFTLIGTNHAAFGFVAAILYLFTEVLVMFFFVGTGVSIKEYVQENSADAQFHRRSIEIKRKLYPPTLLNVLLIMTTFIIGGGVDTGVIPAWIHGLLFYIALVHFFKMIAVQHRCFRENTEIVLEMTGTSSQSNTSD